MLVPPEPFQDFVPGRQVLAYRQATCVVERGDHSTTLSLWMVPPGDALRLSSSEVPSFWRSCAATGAACNRRR
jgi:hypothetical protein